MTNEENLNVHDETPEEKKLRQLEAFRNFVNSKTDAKEPEATAEFFRIMDAEEARKAVS